MQHSFQGKSKKPPVSLRDVLFKYGGDFKKALPEDKNVPMKRIGLLRPRGGELFFCNTIYVTYIKNCSLYILLLRY